MTAMQGSKGSNARAPMSGVHLRTSTPKGAKGAAFSGSHARAWGDLRPFAPFGVEGVTGTRHILSTWRNTAYQRELTYPLPLASFELIEMDTGLAA